MELEVGKSYVVKNMYSSELYEIKVLYKSNIIIKVKISSIDADRETLFYIDKFNSIYNVIEEMKNII